MVRINFKGSNIGEGTYEDIDIVDNSEQVAKRNERYIEDLKLNRDAQTQIESTYISEAEAALRRGASSQEKENKRQIDAARTIANSRIKSLQAQSKEIESITGRASNVTGKGNDTDGWLEFVTNTSEKAAAMYKDYAQKEADFQWDQGIAKAHMFGVSWNNVAWNRRWGDDAIIGANKDELAAIAESNGADPSYVESIRKGNSHYINATKHSLATSMLKVSTSIFEQGLQADSKTIVEITGPDGKQKKVPLNEIDRADPTQVTQAYYQWLPDHIKQQGFGDASSEFLTEGLIEAKSSYDAMIGNIVQNKIVRSNSERSEGALKGFHTYQTPISFKTAVNTAQNINPQLTNKAATESVLGGMGDITIFPDQTAVDSILDNTLGANGQSLRQLYPLAVDKLNKARSAAQLAKYTQYESDRKLEEKGKIDEWYKSIDRDRSDDGQVNQITNEQIDELIVEARNNGQEELISVLQKTKTNTADGITEEKITKQFDEVLANGGVVDPQMVLSSGLSDANQSKYIKLANKSIETAVPDTVIAEFKKIADSQLTLGAKQGYTKDSVRSPSVDLAVLDAVDVYKKDYITAMKDPAMGTEAKAKKYALDSFYNEIRNEKGKYAPDDVTPGGHPYGNFIPKSFEPADDWTKSFAEEFKANGSAVYQTPHEELRPAIEATVENMNRKGKFVYPTSINKMAQMSGGKLTSLDVFRMQSEALGIELPDTFQQAQEVEMSIGQAYKPFLSYKNTTTRTDIAVVGSGQEPIYAQTTALGEQVKSIFGSRESPQAAYDAINRGQGGDTPGGATKRYGKPLTQMTLGEVKRLQSTELNAVGKYQFIEGTLREAAAEAGITDDMVFNEAVQDRIFFVHLDQRGAHQPWERWWIEQGGPGLALNPQEQEIIRRFREDYNPADPWRSARNQNPAIVKHKINAEATQ